MNVSETCGSERVRNLNIIMCFIVMGSIHQGEWRLKEISTLKRRHIETMMV